MVLGADVKIVGIFILLACKLRIIVSLIYYVLLKTKTISFMQSLADASSIMLLHMFIETGRRKLSR